MWRWGKNSPPAVCIVRHNYYPDGHVRRDAETLAAAGYEVHVVALRRTDQPARETLNGVDIHRLPVEHRRGSVARYAWEYLSFALLAFLRVSGLHLRRRLRAVEVDNMPDILVFSALIPRLTGTPVIFYIFDNMPELLAHIWKTGPRHPLVRVLALLERLSAAFATRVVVTQEPARQAVIARGTNPDKVSVVLNCPDETLFSPEQRARPEMNSERFDIVTHGVVLERYGIQVLLDALPAIAAAIPVAHLHVFGAGEYRGELEERARRRGIAGRVTFHGFVPLDELLAQLRRADAGYAGMLCDLMLSNKLMEYVALGVPAVVARWPTFQHYFPEDCAAYFQPAEAADLARAVIRIHDDPDAARERAERASQRYQQYRWPVQREAYLGIYRELLTGRIDGRHIEYRTHAPS